MAKHVVDEVCFPSFVSKKRIEELKEWNPLPGDVYVSCYPRSGSTWVRYMVKLILNNGVDDGLQLLQSVKWLEGTSRTVASLKAAPSPRAFQTFLSYNMSPGLEPALSPAKYIYVARNPKDVVTSYYHRMMGSAYKGTWDEFFEEFMSGDVYYGAWIDHVVSWWKHKDAGNVLFLKYEDVKKDERLTIETIASFIGHPLEPDVVDRILQLTSFQAMQKNAAVNMESTVVDKNHPFIRKGIVGDWKSHLSEDQSKRIDNEFTLEIANDGLLFEFE